MAEWRWRDLANASAWRDPYDGRPTVQARIARLSVLVRLPWLTTCPEMGATLHTLDAVPRIEITVRTGGSDG